MVAKALRKSVENMRRSWELWEKSGQVRPTAGLMAYGATRKDGDDVLCLTLRAVI